MFYLGGMTLGYFTRRIDEKSTQPQGRKDAEDLEPENETHADLAYRREVEQAFISPWQNVL